MPVRVTTHNIFQVIIDRWPAVISTWPNNFFMIFWKMGCLQNSDAYIVQIRTWHQNLIYIISLYYLIGKRQNSVSVTLNAWVLIYIFILNSTWYQWLFVTLVLTNGDVCVPYVKWNLCNIETKLNLTQNI